MTATLTNQTKNNATPTNQAFSSQSLTWDEATFPWDEGVGIWDNPYKMTNQAINSASITNQDKT